MVSFAFKRTEIVFGEVLPETVHDASVENSI